MVQPTDYRLQYVDPTEALMKGIESAQTLRVNDMEIKAAQQKAQDDQLAAQQKAMREQQRQDLVAKYLTTGDSSMLPSIIMQFPEMRESVDTMVTVKGEAYKQDQTSFFARVVPALKSGRGDVALDVIKTRVSALEQSGSDPQQLETLKTAQKALESGDQNAIRQIAALAELSLAAYDDKYAASMKALGEKANADQIQPFLVQKTRAEAQIEQSKADYANAANQASLQAKLTDTEVALRNAASAEERNRLEREKIRLNAELTGYKIDQAKYEKEQRLSSANAVVFDIENSIETVKALKVHAGFERAVGFSSYIPSIAGGDAASFEKMLETLKSQSFLVSIQKMQGMGALSNAEGEKLQIALASLDVGQSEPQLRTNLNMIEILFKKGLAQAKRIQSTVRPKEEESWNR